MTTRDDGSQEGTAEANTAALSAIARADVLVFGPGSFYTSVLPHVLVPGICHAIVKRKGIPKIFVGNMLECPETAGATLNQMLVAFCTHGRRVIAAADVPAAAFVTHVIANRSATPFQRSVGGRRYLRFDDEDPFLRDAGIHTICRDFEDPWERGTYDAACLASVIGALACAQYQRGCLIRAPTASCVKNV